MQVKFESVKTKEEEEALIRAVEKTEAVQGAIELLSGGTTSLAVSLNGKTCFVDKRAIYYIESVDKKTFVYTRDNCYETKYRLYELEEMLGGYFARCSKALIVNLRKVKKVASQLGGRMDAILLNEETIVISRAYVKDIKRRLDI
ncbi:MAG: LytTR family transcriptional regulator DNA-binding domain-containing protein [Lachnospiraceae bacterium]|nr:LytTR family transcriptional regulator DNA-binding domain-containing protein [Lachnospiraceae bacterium]